MMLASPVEYENVEGNPAQILSEHRSSRIALSINLTSYGTEGIKVAPLS
jgi:hypothetical protein